MTKRQSAHVLVLPAKVEVGSGVLRVILVTFCMNSGTGSLTVDGIRAFAGGAIGSSMPPPPTIVAPALELSFATDSTFAVLASRREDVGHALAFTSTVFAMEAFAFAEQTWLLGIRGAEGSVFNSLDVVCVEDYITHVVEAFKFAIQV